MVSFDFFVNWFLDFFINCLFLLPFECGLNINFRFLVICSCDIGSLRQDRRYILHKRQRFIHEIRFWLKDLQFDCLVVQNIRNFGLVVFHLLLKIIINAIWYNSFRGSLILWNFKNLIKNISRCNWFIHNFKLLHDALDL